MADAKAKFRLEGENATGAAFASAVKDAQGAASKMQGIFRTAFASISAAGAVAGFAKIVSHSIELGDELNKAAIKAGVGGRAISELAYAAKMADVDLSSLSNALRFMQTNLSQAASGGKAQQQALDALGLSFQKLKQLEPDKQFELIGDQINALKDPADRARAATELFGRAGADLLPMFEQGAEGIRKAREEAQRFGLSLSDEQQQKLADADKAIKQMKASFEGLALTLGQRVAPGLERVFGLISAFVSGDETAKLRIKLKDLQDEIKAAEKFSLKPNPRTVEQISEIERRLRLREPVSSFHGGVISSKSKPPGYGTTAPTLEEIAPSVRSLFDIRNVLRGAKPVAVDAEELIKVRYDQFGEHMQDALAQVARDTGEAMGEALSPPVIEAIETMRDGLKAAFDDLVDHGQFSFRKLGQFIIAELARKEIYKAIDDISDALERAFSKRSNGGGSLVSGIGSFLGSLFGGHKAAGGPLEQGKWYVAGERGPEPVWGGGPGAFAMGYGRGGPIVNITNQIDARGATSELINALPAVLRANNEAMKADILDTLSRRPPRRR